VLSRGSKLIISLPRSSCRLEHHNLSRTCRTLPQTRVLGQVTPLLRSGPLEIQGNQEIISVVSSCDFKRSNYGELGQIPILFSW
jgi:hypothetical protein